jgi:hypothetical protein
MTRKELAVALSYIPETGVFRWRSPRPKVRVGSVAGYVKKTKGYVYIEVNGKSYSAHRLAWLYMTGEMPALQIDHINGERADNRFCNLRLAMHGQNRANSRPNAKNRYGLKGVRRLPWMKEGDRCWQAQITHNRATRYLGCFRTKEEAHAAYCDAAKRLHGDFFRS